MKKIRKMMFGVTAIASMLVVGNVHSGLAYAAEIDTTPPQGAIIVEGATLKDDVYYINKTEVTLKIEAVDEVSDSSNIQMLISDEPIGGEIALDDQNWEPYASQKSWNLKNIDAENLIYLYLKDEANNISPNIVVDTASTLTITYAGQGENMPAPKTTQYGMAFNVAIQEPKLEGKYFWGWSETEGGSVQWISDSVMEAKYIKGDKTLYAVYKDEPPTLANQASIGDYVNYPAPYDNVYVGKYISTYKGWRVLDISGDEVAIVSAGTPLVYTWPYKQGIATADVIRHLTDEILSGDAYSDGDFEFTSNGFLMPKLTSVFDNEFTKSVMSLRYSDISKITGVEKTAYDYDISKFGSLLYNSAITIALADYHHGYTSHLCCLSGGKYIRNADQRSIRCAPKGLFSPRSYDIR